MTEAQLNGRDSNDDGNKIQNPQRREQDRNYETN